MRKIREVLRLKFGEKRSQREVAAACNIGAATVWEYVRRATAAGLSWPLPEDLDDVALEQKLYAHEYATAVARPMPDLVYLHEELRRDGVTLQLLWTEYRESHPDGIGYSQLCERYSRWAQRLNPTMRQTHRAGEKAFVDFSGSRPNVTDRVTGERTPVELFVGTLGASSMIYAEAVASQELENWIRVHTHMLEAWGGSPDKKKCAHQNDNMHCIACHSSWNPSCFGCHLPQKANLKMPQLHADGEVSRNFTPYNFQTLRDDIYMLARDGDATKNRIGPARSSCAIHVGSYNGNRESIYYQQQTLSGDGFGGTAFSTNVPHTVRGRGARETKQCTDCHPSTQKDNNAWMAQLLMQGTNYLNHIGRYCWVGAGEEGLYGVAVTEREEPQV